MDLDWGYLMCAAFLSKHPYELVHKTFLVNLMSGGNIMFK